MVFTIKDGKLKSQVLNISYQYTDYVSDQSINRSLNSCFPISNNEQNEWKALITLVNETRESLNGVNELVVDYIKAAYALVWGRGGDADDNTELQTIATSLGWDAPDFMAYIASAEAEISLRNSIDKGIDRGVFGVPTVVTVTGPGVKQGVTAKECRNFCVGQQTNMTHGVPRGIQRLQLYRFSDPNQVTGL